MAIIKKIALITTFGFIISIGVPIMGLAQQSKSGPIRIGIFHGGRTALMMRAYENHEFEKRFKG